MEPFSHALIRGVCSAASDFACNLLLACGVGPQANERAGAPAWPSLAEKSAGFVPVGPWNTDGLVVLPTELTPDQSEFLQLLRARGFPIVFAGPGEIGASVVVDNAGGIQQAVEHLAGHGRRRIAFIAGLQRASGDSAQRYAAYLRALADSGLDANPALTAYGLHSYTGGQNAMHQILSAGVPFDAVIASNDRSAMGAISVLNEQGKRVPEDVALIGFDDIPESKAWSPALTTIRNAEFVVGYQAALHLLEIIEGRGSPTGAVVIPVPLIVRQSCGCAAQTSGILPGPRKVDAVQAAAREATVTGRLASEMTEAVMTEVHFTSRTKISNHCHTLVMAFIDSIHAGESGSAGFLKILSTVLNRTDEQDDDVLAWNSAVSVLRAGLASLDFSPQEEALAANLLDTARLAIGELARRGYARVQFQKSEASNRLSLMTAQLLTALDESQVRAVLDRHLGQIGIARALVLMLCPDETDLVEQSEVFYSFGFARDLTGERFYTRRFPPPGWFPSQAGISPQDSQVPNLLLTLLPVAMPGNQRGYAVFETQNLGPLGVIVQNLESALRTSLLYADAIQGRQMAEDANQMKSRFLSMVSHELRTPLNVIVGLSEILLRQQNQPPGPALWEDLERIYFNAQHLSRLIGDVLDLVSSGSGHMRLFREPLDLTEVLRPVIATGEQMAHGKGLAWSASLPQRGLYVIGDRTRLRQAALNLVSNAVKFTARGGVTFDVSVVDNIVTVSVQDTGIGIPLEDQPKLFSEFGQSERSIQRGMSGMGLGLAITRELIEQQGGKIGVVSTGEEGSGSTFFFTLPTTVPHDLQDPTGPQDDSILPGEAPTRRGPAPRVLFLTNRADSAEPLAAQLEAKGYALEVCAYQDNPEWLFQLLDSPPGAVVIDEDLAANRGWDIFAVLKRNDATALLPVLVCRMDAERGDAVIELDYQLKPLTPGHIARALNIHNLNAAPGSDGNGAQNPSEAPVTVLVVDDDAAIRFTHTRLVQQQLPNSRVLQAENGREAQEIIRHTRPDLVLLDLLMPEVDGFAVLESLRGQESTCDVPVIILTAKTITEEDIAQLNRGVAAILTKGLFRGSEIGEHIEQVLKRAPGLGTASQRLVRRAIAYIHANYAESLTRDQIAEYVSVTPDHLADCFHQEMGITPVAYLYRYRIARARLLLEEGGRNITEVALAVGFSDSAHFSRVFQREVGTSPRAYLRSRG